LDFDELFFSFSLIHVRMNRGNLYECTNYKKRSYDSQHGSPPPINAWCSFALHNGKEDRLSHGLRERKKKKSVTAELEVTRGILLPGSFTSQPTAPEHLHDALIVKEILRMAHTQEMLKYNEC
jgi:hypothetical protein